MTRGGIFPVFYRLFRCSPRVNHNFPERSNARLLRTFSACVFPSAADAPSQRRRRETDGRTKTEDGYVASVSRRRRGASYPKVKSRSGARHCKVERKEPVSQFDSNEREKNNSIRMFSLLHSRSSGIPHVIPRIMPICQKNGR